MLYTGHVTIFAGDTLETAKIATVRRRLGFCALIGAGLNLCFIRRQNEVDVWRIPDVLVYWLYVAVQAIEDTYGVTAVFQ